MEKAGHFLAYTGFLLLPALYLRLWHNLNLADIFFVGAFIVFFIVYKSQVIFSIRKNPLNIPLFIFFLGFCISTIFAEQPLESLFALIQLLFCIYVVTTVIYFCNTKKVLQMIVITTAIHVVFLILFMIGILDIGVIKRAWGNIRLSFGNVEPNIAARVYFIGLVIMIFILKDKLWGLIKLGTLLAILVTVSRTGLLALLMIFTSKWKFGKIILAAVLVLIMISLLVNVSSVLNIDIIRNYTFRVSNLLHVAALSAKQRLYMYTQGPILFFEKYFLVGTGMDNPSPVGHAHNVMISVAIGNGVFGLIGYILMYIIIILIAWSLEEKFGILMILVIGSMIFDLFMPVSENRIYWFPFSLTIGIYLKRLRTSQIHYSTVFDSSDFLKTH